MKNNNRGISMLYRSFLAASIVFMSGCSLLPYEEDFACQRNATYGKCVSVEGAYEEAITGVPQGKVIRKEGVSDEPLANTKRADNRDDHTDDPEMAAYAGYRAELYTQLRNLVAEPETPMVKQPVQSRTLILSYSPHNTRDRLYMPRYVYSIHRPAEFVMGQYRLETDPSMRMIRDFLGHDDSKE